MAYYTQDKKKEVAPKIKNILNRYGLKGSLSVRHNSTVVLNIRSGKLDLLMNYNANARDDSNAVSRGYMDVNPYHYKKHFSGVALTCIDELMTTLNDGNHDRSDVQSDYFDVGWYVDVKIGTWDTPYIAG